MIKYKNNNLNLCLKIQEGNDSKADRSKELISVKIKKIGKSKIMKEINGNCDQTKKNHLYNTWLIHHHFVGQFCRREDRKHSINSVDGEKLFASESSSWLKFSVWRELGNSVSKMILTGGWHSALLRQTARQDGCSRLLLDYMQCSHLCKVSKRNKVYSIKLERKK